MMEFFDAKGKLIARVCKERPEDAMLEKVNSELRLIAAVKQQQSERN